MAGRERSPGCRGYSAVASSSDVGVIFMQHKILLARENGTARVYARRPIELFAPVGQASGWAPQKIRGVPGVALQALVADGRERVVPPCVSTSAGARDRSLFLQPHRAAALVAEVSHGECGSP